MKGAPVQCQRETENKTVSQSVAATTNTMVEFPTTTPSTAAGWPW